MPDQAPSDAPKQERSGEISPSSPKVSLSERSTVLATKAAVGLAHQLPYERRVRWFGGFSRRIVSPLAGYRRRSLDNLDYVWPDMPLAERQAIADAAADNAGRMLIEQLSGAELHQRMRAVQPRGPGVAPLDAARAAGRPIMLITGHIGNYVAARSALIHAGVALGGFFRPLGIDALNANYVGSVQGQDLNPLFDQSATGMKNMLRWLRAGGAAMVLNDLYVGSGVEMDFLGRPARTGLAMAELALKFDALVLPFYGIRRDNGLDFSVDVEAPIAPDSAENMTAAFNRSIEARIMEHPGQWLWSHRRWKRKWNKGAGGKDLPHPATRPRRMG